MYDEAVWCEVRLDEVAEVIDGYELRRDDAWYHEVDWGVVCAAFNELLQSKARNGCVVDLTADLEPVAQDLSDVNHSGLMSLILEPITVTQVQLTNGGHRLAAMRRQRVESVPGMFHRDDVGVSVDPGRAYPIRDR